MRELGEDPGQDKDLQPHRLCQPLTLERDEGARLAVDVHEMPTVPHETALRAYALHRSEREAAHRTLRRDARAADRPPARAAHRNVAFLRCVPRGDPARYKAPPAAGMLVVKQPAELVSFDKVWRPHVLSLRITKKFCQFLEAEHPLVPRPEALVRAGLLQAQDAGMLPPAPPLPRRAHRPPPPPRVPVTDQ
ncbi:uncharacterized protein LOC113213091 isoform X2 [Frankliniella occidentalis]|nr:uncharacterized protein LOC113213091 isoform X2 [Frankliniella occidentalis]